MKKPPSLSFCICGALGIWMGVLAIHFYIAMVVWPNEEAPVAKMGLIALSIYAMGLIAWVPTRYIGGSQPAWRFGLLLAVITVARQALPGELTSQILTYSAIIAWLWWLPAFLAEAARRGALTVVTPAVLLGMGAEVAGQTALHGESLTMLTSFWGILGAIVLAAVFVLALYRSMAGKGIAISVKGAVRPFPSGTETAAARGAVILGPYLFLQMTYLTQLGRAQALTGWSLLAVSALIQASLLTGLLAVAWKLPRNIRILLGVAGVGLLLPGELKGITFLFVMIIQAGLGVALSAAFTPSADQASPKQAEAAKVRPISVRIYGLTAVGALFFFILFFLFYHVYGLSVLWPVAALVVILVGALPPTSSSSRLSPAAPLILAGSAFLGLASEALPFAQPIPAAGPAPRELKVLTYNVYQGFDAYTAPGIERLAAVIEAANADLVSLQEIPRGDNLAGGSDLADWLHWRFPQYQVVYGPQEGDMMDIMIMSRYPIHTSGTEHYRLVSANSITGQASPPRGLVWATIPTESGDLLFICTHLTAYSRFTSDRNAEVQALTKLWNHRDRTIIAGDFNAGPTDDAIQHLVAAGLNDVPAAFGLGSTFTKPTLAPNQRIDYIFSSPDVESISAQVLRTPASDHLPVQATIRIK